MVYFPDLKTPTIVHTTWWYQKQLDLLQLIILDKMRNLLAFHIFQRTVKYDDHETFLYP